MKSAKKHASFLNTAEKLRREPSLIFPNMLSISHGQHEWYNNDDMIKAIKCEAKSISVNKTQVLQ